MHSAKAGSNDGLRIVISGASKPAVDLVPIIDQLGARRYSDISGRGIVPKAPWDLPG
jgi:hypothetical protein